ncbi:50S ribosomal protein L23 [Saprospira grandis]|uniref:Large ribosomal subunit protein uL23 n=1 Tax=Saprospira grandis (strain Lewin) TaxID=984262 RepID=H6L0P1_SAPGL|nr:50S ribosomal protein L23 [Saprospira grandis]AFC24577.1 50S ribosomal protein L23 [Saprospira grandis str. Lewin]WBM76016.1 50S ribosomal protein L23 [Saprospira grandis]
MAKKAIIIKPLLSEKSTELADNPISTKYTFVVAMDANKIEIKKAVEEQFGVTVDDVNTSIRPGKRKSRVVKGRMVSGRTSPYKKAVVTVAEGEFIEGFYGIDTEEELEEVDGNETEAAEA